MLILLRQDVFIKTKSILFDIKFIVTVPPFCTQLDFARRVFLSRIKVKNKKILNSRNSYL